MSESEIQQIASDVKAAVDAALVESAAVSKALNESDRGHVERQIRLANRYQFQPWYVKAYRWMRHMPLAYAAGLFLFPFWYGALPREEKARLWGFFQEWGVFRDIQIGMAHAKMNWLYEWDEVMAGWDARGNQ